MSSLSIRIRHLFPALEKYRYFDAAGASPLPIPVAQAYDNFTHEIRDSGSVLASGWFGQKEKARGLLADFLQAKKESIAFTASTSMSMHIVAQLLKNRGARRIVSLSTEFPSTTVPFLHLGYDVVAVKPRANGSYFYDDIADAMKSADALAVSVVQFSTGFRLEVEKLKDIAQARKIPLVLNGSQSLGQVPISLANGVDFLAATSHKWLMAGSGLGMLFVAQKYLNDALPLAGWLSTPDPERWKSLAGAELSNDAEHSVLARGTRIRADASALEAGGSSWGHFFALEAALKIQSELGTENILKHNIALQRELREGLRKLGFAPTISDAVESLAGTCVFHVKGDVNDAVSQLAKENIVVAPRGGGLRVATHCFNNSEDVQVFLEAAKRVLT